MAGAAEANKEDCDKMEVDKAPAKHDDSKEELDKYKKYIRAKTKEFEIGIKKLQRSQERDMKNLLLNVEGVDYQSSITMEEHKLIADVKEALEAYCNNKKILQEQEIEKNILLRMKEMNQELALKKKHVEMENLKQVEKENYLSRQQNHNLNLEKLLEML